MRLISLLFIFLIFFMSGAFCQKGVIPLDEETGLHKEKSFNKAPRFMLGLKGGGGLHFLHLQNRFTIMEFEENSGAAHKKYDDFYQNHGWHAGLMATLTLTKYFSASFQPAFQQVRFGYKNEYEWMRETQASTEKTLGLTYNFDHRLRYLHLPVLARYQFTNRTVKPYVQLGGFYNLLIQAHKFIDVQGTDHEAGGAYRFNGKYEKLKVNNLLQNTGGITAGGGVSYTYGRIRAGLDFQYLYMLNNLVRAGERSSKPELVYGVYDLMDNMRLSALNVSLTLVYQFNYDYFFH